MAYERALRLKPSYKDAKHNLQFAQSRIVDNIEDTQSFFLSTWLKAVRNALGQHTWIVLSITIFILMLLGFLFFAFSQTLWVRKTAFYLSVIALVISVVACINAGSLHSRDTQRAEAIITQGVVNAKSSPDRSGNDLFTVHEGTKVEIIDSVGGWSNIELADGRQGWIPSSDIETI